MNFDYNVMPISLRMSLKEFFSYGTSLSATLMEDLKKYVESKIPAVPEYCTREVKIDKVTILSGCNNAMISYGVDISIDKTQLICDLSEIVEKQGLKLEEVKLGYIVDSPYVDVKLEYDKERFSTPDSFQKEKDINREIMEKFRMLHIFFRVHLDSDMF